MIAREEQQRLDERARDLANEVRELNRAQRDMIAARLSPAAASALEQAYQRAAHPWAFADDDALHDRLAAALRLHDLSDDQREQLNALAAAYRRRYDELSRRLAETGGDWQAEKRLRFERDELNAKTTERLGLILEDAQRRRIGDQGAR
jgi:hypothetical protein